MGVQHDLVSIQKLEGLGGDSEEPKAVAGPSFDHAEAEAEENGQQGRDYLVLDDEDDLYGSEQLTQQSQNHGKRLIVTEEPSLAMADHRVMKKLTREVCHG